MSFNISSVGVDAGAPLEGSAGANATQSSEPVRSVASGDAVSVDVSAEPTTVPDAPPPEVHHAIAVAAQSYQRLQSSGQQLSFSLDSGSGALTVKLQDLSGNHISTLSVSEALRIAGGTSLQ